MNFEPLDWPTHENAKQIPIPKSTLADVRNSNDVRFEFYLANTTFEDYKAYVEECKSKGFTVPEEAVRAGLLAARWPARFEIISRDPLVIFDGAHNPEGIETAVESIKRYFGDKKVCILTGVMRDKDYNYIAGKFAEISDRAFTITPQNPRALPAEEYAKVLEGVGITATSYSSVADALVEAKEYARSSDTALLCLGSLYMYCEVIEAI